MKALGTLLLILFIPIFLQGCGKSNGEAIAEEVCHCYETAKSNLEQMPTCLNKQLELQKQIQGDPAETLKFIQKISACMVK